MTPTASNKLALVFVIASIMIAGLLRPVESEPLEVAKNLLKRVLADLEQVGNQVQDASKVDTALKFAIGSIALTQTKTVKDGEPMNLVDFIGPYITNNVKVLDEPADAAAAVQVMQAQAATMANEAGIDLNDPGLIEGTLMEACQYFTSLYGEVFESAYVRKQKKASLMHSFKWLEDDGHANEVKVVLFNWASYNFCQNFVNSERKEFKQLVERQLRGGDA